MVDQTRCGSENMRGGAVILLQLDHLGFGKILLEAQDVRDLRAAPRIDRLIIIADAADILMALGEQSQPEILRAVGVLIFVDENIFEPLLIAFQYLPVGFQQVENMEQKIAEVAGVQRDQSGLIGSVKFLAAAIGVAFVFTGIEVLGIESPVLPLVDQAGQHPWGPAFLVNLGGADQLLEQAKLVIGIENGEIALQADQLGMLPQHFCADAVEGAEPRHAFETLSDDCPDPFLHLAGRLVGEGHRENLARPGLARKDDMRQPPGEGSGLAGACASQHQYRAFGRENGFALRRVQSLHIRRIGFLRMFDRFGHA